MKNKEQGVQYNNLWNPRHSTKEATIMSVKNVN